MSEKPIKVLLIESDPKDARLVRKYLQELASVPSTLNWVKSLAEGIDALSRDAYSILLLDLNLPDSRGLATVKGIMDSNPKIPVLVLTGYDEKYLAIQTLHEGAEDYIVKNDLTNHQLINSIRNVIERYSIRQELREKNEELENICKNFFNLVGMQADGVVVVDARGIIRYMNPVAMDLLDFQFDPLADTPFTYGVKEDRVLDVEIYRKRKPPCLIEMRQSNFIWEGKPAHLISINDVTDQRRAEDLLRRNQAMLLEAQNIAHIGSWEHDIATGREIWSNEMFQIFKIECPSGDIAPLDWYRSIHPDDWKKIENGMQNAIKNKVPLNLEFRIIHPDGTTHWGGMIGKILNDEEGRVIKVYGTVQDITERKLVAKSLKQERDRAQHYLDVAGVMLLALDNNGIITLINKKGCEILGYGEEAILGKVWFDNFLPQDLRSKVKINFQKFFTEGIKKFKEQTPIPVLCKGGELKYITFRNSLVRDKGGNIIGILSSGDDITERKRAQESLQQSEEKYRTLVEQLNDIICSSDTEGVVTFISPVVEAITGFAPKQLLNRKMCDFYIEEDRPRFMDNFKRVLAGESFSAEYRILHKSGNLMWIRISARPLFKGNMLIGTQGIVTDITSQKLAEQALRESEAQLKDAQALGQIGSWEYDYKTRKVKWSDQTYQLLDRDPSLGPFTAEEEAKCYTADLFQKVKDYRRRAVEEGKSYKYDVEMVFPIDKHLFLAAILQPIKDADGRVVKLFGTLQDITERKRVQESLQQSEEKYRTLVEQLNVIIYTTDTEGVVTFVSPVAETITGFPSRTLLKRKVFDFCIEEDRPILRDNFNRVLAGERVTEEYRIIHKSGSLIWLQANSRPLYRGNTLIGIQGFETDITSKKLAEQALRESEAHLKHAQTLGEIGSWEFDIKTKKANWSDQLYRLFDRDPSLGPFSAEEEKYVYPRGYLEREKEYRHRAFAEGKVFKYDSEMILPSGRHVFLLSMVASLKDAQGKVTMLFGAVQDITERKLAEQDLKFRNVLLSTQQETSIDGILVVNEKGNILSWNQRFVSMWDISADTIATPTDNLIIKSVIGKFVNPERYFEKMKYLYAHQYETSQDEIALKNGRNFEIYSAPMLGADTKYYGRVWYFRDITERKRAETALRESEQKFRNFIEQSAEALFLTDEQGKICLWNSSSEHIFGVKSAIAIGKNLWDVQFEFVSKANKNSQYYNSLKDNIVNVLNTGHGDWVNKLMEREIYLPTGEYAIIETITFTIQSEKGFLLGSVNRNVTEHKRSEEQLHKRLTFERMLAEICSLAIIIESLETLLEKSLEILGKTLEITRVSIFKDFPEEKVFKISKEWIVQSFSKSDKHIQEFSPTNTKLITEEMEKNQVKIYFDLNEGNLAELPQNQMLPGVKTMLMVPLVADQDYYGFLGFEDVQHLRTWKGEDIDILRTTASIIAQTIARHNYREHLQDLIQNRTKELQTTVDELEHVIQDRQKVQQELLEAKIMAETANRAKSEFLANMSHELRTPLNAIIGFSQILQDGIIGKVTSEEQELLGNILESGNHLLSLINEILDLSKIEAGKVELKPSSFPVKPFLEHCQYLFREKAAGNGLNLSLEVGKDIDLIVADEIKLKQIMFNLLSNAVKYTLTGGEVGIEAQKIGNVVQFTVWDTGIGIAPENFSKLFQPFSRIETIYTKGFSGTGLGLHYSKKLIELHGGNIWVESEEGKGSKFHFNIPLVCTPPATIDLTK